MSEHKERLVELLLDIREVIANGYDAEPDDFYLAVARSRAKIAPLAAEREELLTQTTPSAVDEARIRDIKAEIAIRSLKPRGLEQDGIHFEASVAQAVDRFVKELTPEEAQSLYGSARNAQSVMRNVMKLVAKPSRFEALGLNASVDDLGDGLAITNIAKAFEESSTPYTDAVDSALGAFPVHLNL